MAGFAEYEKYDALGLAALVKQGQVTPEELLEAAIERIEARNPAVNAVVMRFYDEARQAIAAGLPDGPLKGVPFLLKDLGSGMAGTRTARGSRFFADTPPLTVDSLHVGRMKQAGLSGRMLLQIHDELVFEVPVAEVAASAALVKDLMEHPPGFALRVPLVADVGSGHSWAEAKG